MNFYTECRKADGTDYKLQSLKCIRAGINRHMKSKRGIDIISNENFVRANEMFRGDGKQLRIKGKGLIKSTEVISEKDLAKIPDYFQHDIMNKPDPKKIQKCLIFYIIYFFCRRGHENLHAMTWDTFKIDFDAEGRCFVYQHIDEFDKNHGIDTTDPANKARMYEKKGKNISFSQSATDHDKLH